MLCTNETEEIQRAMDEVEWEQQWLEEEVI
jgi:hypothetical protein